MFSFMEDTTASIRVRVSEDGLFVVFSMIEKFVVVGKGDRANFRVFFVCANVFKRRPGMGRLLVFDLFHHPGCQERSHDKCDSVYYFNQ